MARFNSAGDDKVKAMGMPVGKAGDAPESYSVLWISEREDLSFLIVFGMS